MPPNADALSRILDWLLSQDLISLIILLLLARGEIRTREALNALKLLDMYHATSQPPSK